MAYSTPSSQQPLPDMAQGGRLPDMSQGGGLPDMSQRGGLFGEYSSPETVSPSVACDTTMVSSPRYSSTAFGGQLSARSGTANKARPSVRRVGKQFRRGPSNLSKNQVEELVLMAEAFKRIAWEKRERRARLKRASDKFKEEIQKCIKEEFDHKNIKSEFIPKHIKDEFIQVGKSEVWLDALLDGSDLEIVQIEEDEQAILGIKFVVALK